MDRHLDSPHAAASLVYSPPPPHSAIQGLKKLSKMQLHRAEARAFDYTVHDRSLPADRRRHSDYLTAFHFFGRFPFQDLWPCDTSHHVIRLLVNNRFPQNDYWFCLKTVFAPLICTLQYIVW